MYELRPIAKVRIVVDDLNRDEIDTPKIERWTYKVKDCGNGLGYIQVIDEDGITVGWL